MSCKICKSEVTRIIPWGKFHLVKCNNCKILYNAEFPENEEIREYYRDNYRLLDEEYLSDERRRYFRYPENIGLIKDIHEVAPPPATILDIGCDKGYFIDEARRYGYDVAGVELSDSANEYTKRLKLDVKKDIGHFEKKFDIVTMWHVLEHIPDPLEYLLKVKTKLNDSGRFFVRVPAIESFWSRLMKDKWEWFQPDNHIFHFGVESLSYLLKEAGFEIDRIALNNPNTRSTKKAYRLANRVFREQYCINPGIKKKIAQRVKNIIQIEIYAVGIVV